VPPFPLKVNSTVHLAQYVVFALGTVEFASNRTPPVGADVLNQPRKVAPGLLGCVGIVPIVNPAVLESVCVAGVPPAPLALKVNVTVLRTHLAQYVVLTLGTVEFVVNCVPPVSAVVLNQPTNVKPALVGCVGIVPIRVPDCLTSGCEAGVPPLALKVSVTFGSAFHLAQYVVLLPGTVEFALNCVPPVAAEVLNHPTNVNPSLVGTVGIVPI